MGPTAGVRLLYVDDDPEAASAIADGLERADGRFAVETEPDATAAVTRLADGGVDCVVTAYALPDGDGVELLEAVREEYPDLPVVLYTSEGSEAVASAAISAGVTDYVLRETATPDHEELADRVRAAVDRRSGRAGAPATDPGLETIAEHATDVLWKFSADWGDLHFVNSAYEDVWGRSKAELRADPSSFLEGVHPDDRPAVEDAMARLSAGESVDVEYRVNGAEDVWRWVWVQGEPVVDDAGDVEAVVGFARDVTERKRREKQVERQNERLEAFASVVSHDIRDPLTVVQGRVELARAGSDSEHLAVAERTLDRIEALIEDLLALAKTGTGTGERKPIELPHLVERCAEAVDTDGANLEVTTDRTVRADPSRLRQLLENLLRNALEHGAAGDRSAAEDLTVTVGGLERGFYVADDGPGVPPEDRDRVFEPGFTTAMDGTGFGLRIVEQIADAHGWDVAVTDSEAGGARFEVTGVTEPE